MTIIKKMYLVHDFLYETVDDIPAESLDGKDTLKAVYVRLPQELANDKEIDTTVESIEILRTVDDVIYSLIEDREHDKDTVAHLQYIAYQYRHGQITESRALAAVLKIHWER